MDLLAIASKGKLPNNYIHGCEYIAIALTKKKHHSSLASYIATRRHVLVGVIMELWVNIMWKILKESN